MRKLNYEPLIMKWYFPQKYIQKKLKSGFIEDKSGAAIIEAGFVLLPTLALILGIMEFAMIFIIGSSLQFAIDKGTDMARTGHLQAPPLNLSDILTESKANLLFNSSCLTIEGIEYPSLGDFGNDINSVTLGDTTPTLGSASRKIGVFTLTCDWNFFTPFLTHISDGDVNLTAHAVVRYEDS